MSARDQLREAVASGELVPVTAAAPETPATPGRDLSNAQFAGANGAGQITILMPRVVMTRDEALVHAAWLILLADGELEISGIIAAIGGAS